MLLLSGIFSCQTGRSLDASVLRRLRGKEPDQLAARTDVELAKYAAQVELDCFRAQEQPGSHVSVGQALGNKECDLELLRRQPLGDRWVTPVDVLTGRPQFHPCALSPRTCLEVLECLERRTELLAAEPPLPGSPQPLAGPVLLSAWIASL